MCAVGSCANAPDFRLLMLNTPDRIAQFAIDGTPLSVARAPVFSAAASWSHVTMMSSRSSSIRTSSMSVIALAEANGVLRPSGWRASEVPPTTTSELVLPRMSASSPFSRKTSCPATPFTRKGSSVLLTRSTTHSSPSSVSRCVDSAERGSRPFRILMLTLPLAMARAEP